MKRLIAVLFLALLIPVAEAAIYCGTDYTNEKDVIKDSSGRTIVKVDDNGNIFIRSSSFSKNSNVPDDLIDHLLFKVSNVLKAAFGYENSYIAGSTFEDQTDFGTSGNNFSIVRAGTVLLKLDSDGGLYSRGKLAYQGAQAGCPSDGIYCNADGNEETRDYSCRTSDAGCAVSINNPEVCGTSGCASTGYACNNAGTALEAPYYNRGCTPSSLGGSGCYENANGVCSVPCSGGNQCLPDNTGYTYLNGCNPGSISCIQPTYYCNHASCVSETTLRRETACSWPSNTCGTTDDNCGGTSSGGYYCSYDGNNQESLHWTHWHSCNPDSNSCSTYTHTGPEHAQNCGGPADPFPTDTGICDPNSPDNAKQQAQRHTCNSATNSCSSYTTYSGFSCGADSYSYSCGGDDDTRIGTHIHTCNNGICQSYTHGGHTTSENCAGSPSYHCHNSRYLYRHVTCSGGSCVSGSSGEYQVDDCGASMCQSNTCI